MKERVYLLIQTRVSYFNERISPTGVSGDVLSEAGACVAFENGWILSIGSPSGVWLEAGLIIVYFFFFFLLD